MKDFRRRNFEKKHGRNSLTRFFKALAGGRHDLPGIARRFGIKSKQQCAEIYKLEPLPYIGESFRERRRKYRGRLLHLTKPFPRVVTLVRREARKHGISVRHVNHLLKYRVVTGRWELLLGENTCKIRSAKGFALRGYGYSHVAITSKGLRTYPVQVLVARFADRNDFYIIPSREILERFPLKSCIQIHLPEKPTPKSSWQEFRNAWHSLKKPL